MIEETLPPQNIGGGLVRILESDKLHKIVFGFRNRTFSAFFAPGSELKNATSVSVFPDGTDMEIPAEVKEQIESYIRAKGYMDDIDYPAKRNS